MIKSAPTVAARPMPYFPASVASFEMTLPPCAFSLTGRKHPPGLPQTASGEYGIRAAQAAHIQLVYRNNLVCEAAEIKYV